MYFLFNLAIFNLSPKSNKSNKLKNLNIKIKNSLQEVTQVIMNHLKNLGIFIT